MSSMEMPNNERTPEDQNNLSVFEISENFNLSEDYRLAQQAVSGALSYEQNSAEQSPKLDIDTLQNRIDEAKVASDAIMINRTIKIGEAA